MEKSNPSLEIELKTLKTQMNIKNLEITRLNHELDNFRSEYNKTIKEKQEILNEFALLKSNKNSLEDEAELLFLENEKLKTENEENKAKIKQFEEEIGKILRELSLSNEKCADYQMNFEKINTKYLKSQEEIKEISAELVQSKSEISFNSKKESDLLNRIKNSAAQIRNLEREIALLNQKNTDICEDYEKKINLMDDHTKILQKQNDQVFFLIKTIKSFKLN